MAKMAKISCTPMILGKNRRKNFFHKTQIIQSGGVMNIVDC
jgi:hypothetical protein